jgi:rhodanese-related sulfurtransferase
VRPEQEVVVVAPQDREEEVVVRLARIGFDRVAGYLRDPEAAFLAAPEHVVRASRLTAPELDRALHRAEPPAVVDVRNPGELIAGTIPGALHVPLAQLPHRLAEIPRDRPVVVHCAGGYRSSVAASLLRREGWSDVSDLLGGFAAWAGTVAQPVG